MATALHWTSADLETLPEDNKRYEIIKGDIFMSRQPHLYHQGTCGEIHVKLWIWSKETGAGQVFFAPGIIFNDDEDVVPDVVWISHARLAEALRDDGMLHLAPELVIEVLSPGSTNERRDREAKLKLYSRRGVHEYWIADWRTRQIEVYRRTNGGLELPHLEHIATLFHQDTLTSPLLPGFACPLHTIFEDIKV
ncbi:MAG: Uma2 family endonuclease [Pyrinomonadaceae bacterium MAG19_C2-C3]|nr:Uma2 family endonuclease [Pyrinomonadaceae bacterium MAG19_C2-C3]